MDNSSGGFTVGGILLFSIALVFPIVPIGIGIVIIGIVVILKFKSGAKTRR